MSDGSTRRSWIPAAATLTILVGLASACGGGDSEPLDLSPLGQEGRTIANSSGCAACHGTDGQGGAGPGWVDLAGSTVELDDGSFVVADDAYLVRAIKDPAVEIRAGYSLRMPTNNLDDDEIQAVIAYIHDLSSEPSDD